MKFIVRGKALLEDRPGAGISPRLGAALLVLICLGGVALHLTLLDGTFLAVDDRKQITGNATVKELNWENFKEVTFTNFMGRNSNPMFITYMLNWAVSPTYRGFSVANLAFFSVFLLVFYRFTRLFLREQSYRLAATTLLASHGLLADMVAFMGLRCHYLGVFFVMSTFVCWDNYQTAVSTRKRLGWYLFALVTGWLAVWSKNYYLTIGPLIVLYDLYRRRRLTWAFFLDKLPFVVFAVVPLVIVRITAHLGLKRLQAVAFGGSIFATLLNDAIMLVEYALLLLVPSPTHPTASVYPTSGMLEVSPSAALMASALPPVGAIGILAAMTGLLIFAAYRYKVRLPLFAALMSFVILTPVMNIPPHLWAQFGFRYNILPVMFFCPALFVMARALMERLSWPGRAILVSLAAALIAAHAAQTWSTCLAWDTEILHAKTCHHNFPDNLYCLKRISHIHQYNKNYRSAVYYYKIMDDTRTSRQNAKSGRDSGFNLGTNYYRIGDLSKAEFYLTRSLLRDKLYFKTRARAKKLLAEIEKQKEPMGPGQTAPE